MKLYSRSHILADTVNRVKGSHGVELYMRSRATVEWNSTRGAIYSRTRSDQGVILNLRREQPRSELYLRCKCHGAGTSSDRADVFTGNRQTAVRDLSSCQLLPTPYPPSAESSINDTAHREEGITQFSELGSKRYVCRSPRDTTN